jgi:hypothetical protein
VSVCFLLTLLGNGSVKTFPRQRKHNRRRTGRSVLHAVRVVSSTEYIVKGKNAISKDIVKDRSALSSERAPNINKPAIV